MKSYRIYLRGIIFCFVLLWTAVCRKEVFAAEGNQGQAAAVLGAGEDAWMTYRALDNGYITVTAQPADPASLFRCTVRLHDAKRQALSGTTGFYAGGGAASASSVSYGVKKNAVYYIQLKAEGACSVRCGFHKVKEKSGRKKSKAKNLAQKKQAKGIIAAGERAADWYKMKVKKKQTLHFYYSGKTNEKLVFTFSGKYLKTAKRFILHGAETVQHAYSAERVQPGTYYVKVERAKDTSSGFYTLKWR